MKDLNCKKLLNINKLDSLYSQVLKILNLDISHPLTSNRHKYEICIPHRRVKLISFSPTTNPYT